MWMLKKVTELTKDLHKAFIHLCTTSFQALGVDTAQTNGGVWDQSGGAKRGGEPEAFGEDAYAGPPEEVLRQVS